MDIQILSKSRAKEFRLLSSKKERDRTGLFLIEGEKCVKDTLRAFELQNLVCSQSWLEKNQNICKEFANEILISDKRGLEIISSFSSIPEVIAIFKKNTGEDKVPLLERDKIYLLLDEIQDPGNLGTIIRTCDWFGVYDIYASKNTVDVYSPKVVQSTMGSLSRVKVNYLDLKELLEKNRGIPLLGTVLDGQPLSEIQNFHTGFIIMGNEGRGISEELKKMLDLKVTIPPVNRQCHPDSLNVAIATAILLENFNKN